MDRCALFVDAGYVLTEGAHAVHGTRNRGSVSWDYPGLLKLLGGLSRDRTGLPLLRCYWYDVVADSGRVTEHDTLADMPGVKLRLSKARPGRQDGVEADLRRDLTALARNRAISDAVIVSGEEDLAPVIAEMQDQGIRVVLLHVRADGEWVASRVLRQECDDIIDMSGLHLRPFVELIQGAEPEAVGSDFRELAAAAASAALDQSDQPALAAPTPQLYPAPVGPGHDRTTQLLASVRDQSAHDVDRLAQVAGQPSRAETIANQAARQPSAPGQHRQDDRPQPRAQDQPDPQPRSPQYQAPELPREVAPVEPAVPAGQPSYDLSPQQGGAGQLQHQHRLAQPGVSFQGQRPGGAHRSVSAENGQRPGIPPSQAALNGGMPGAGTMPPLPQHNGGYEQPANGYAGNGRASGSGQQPGQPFPGQHLPQDQALPPGPGLLQGQARGQPGPQLDQPGQHAPQPDQPGQLGEPNVGHPAPGHQGNGLPPVPGPPSRGGRHPAQQLPQRPGHGQPFQRGDEASGGLPDPQRMLAPQRQLPASNGLPYPDRGFGPQPGQYGEMPHYPPDQFAPQPGQYGPPGALSRYPPQPAPVAPQPGAVSIGAAVQSAHAEGLGFGESVAREAPALWLEAVLARKPRMPSDLEAQLLQGSALPIDSLLHDEVRHALRRGFWDALERSRH